MGVVEYQARRGQPVERRRLDPGVAGEAHGVGPQGVDGDQDDIGPLVGGGRTGGARTVLAAGQDRCKGERQE
jgi:hypothetical protein